MSNMPLARLKLFTRRLSAASIISCLMYCWWILMVCKHSKWQMLLNNVLVIRGTITAHESLRCSFCHQQIKRGRKNASWHYFKRVSGDGKNNQLLDASSSEMNNTFLFFMQPSRHTGKPIVMWATGLNNQEASGCIKDCSWSISLNRIGSCDFHTLINNTLLIWIERELSHHLCF